MNTQKVICFGEVLWDLLPTGRVAGGAPMNVAFHLNQLGIDASMISRIGADDLGTAIFDFLTDKKVPTVFVQTDKEHPTGIVRVELNENGHPKYEIVEDVAWDRIKVAGAATEAVAAASAFVFGSLIARSSTSRDTLLHLISQARFSVFDVNLRQPFFSRNLIDMLLNKAHFVKMNDDELTIISDWNGFPGSLQDRMTALKTAFGLDVLVVTLGENGAISLDQSGFNSHPGIEVKVQDTIGSGDAFLAGYLSRFLAQKSSAECLDFGCRMGAYVASKQGGTPPFNPNEPFLFS